MLHILLLILKIIGITLGILLGIIIIALCLALFVPVRYRIEAERTEGEGAPPVEVTAKVTWLLHFINMRLSYSTDLRLRLRILFITVFRLPAKKKRLKKKPKDKPKDKSRDKPKDKVKDKSKDKPQNKPGKKNNKEAVAEKNRSDEGYAVSGEIEKDTSAAKGSRTGKTAQTERAVNDNNDNNNSNDYSGQPENDEGEDGQKLSIKDKLIKIWDFFKNIWYTIRGICDRIREIFENIEYYLDVIKSDTFKAAFSLCKDELGSVFSYIKPRKFNAELVIGTGDPASTGQILSYYYGILYPLIGNHVIIVGDFEGKRIEGSVFIKGKMRLFTFLKAALRIYFNKDIKKLLKLFKKEDE